MHALTPGFVRIILVSAFYSHQQQLSAVIFFKERLSSGNLFIVEDTIRT